MNTIHEVDKSHPSYIISISKVVFKVLPLTAVDKYSKGTKPRIFQFQFSEWWKA